jgi:vancomycin permeability regulator SanA
VTDDPTVPRRRWLRLAVVAATAATLVATPYLWTRIAAAGHLYPASEFSAGGTGPSSVDVVLVLGAQVAPDRRTPMPFLRGRLDTAAAVLRAGRAKVILVSGDADRGFGNETAVMTAYLTGQLDIPVDRIVADPHGLDTYDSCRRARQVYGVTRALIVTQAYHLPRAVAVCRAVGIDADGVAASCAGCRTSTLVKNTLRDFVACSKAAVDVLRERDASITSPPDPAVRDAIGRT